MALPEDLEGDEGGLMLKSHKLTSKLGTDGATTPSPDEGFQEEEKVKCNRVRCGTKEQMSHLEHRTVNNSSSLEGGREGGGPAHPDSPGQ